MLDFNEAEEVAGEAVAVGLMARYGIFKVLFIGVAIAVVIALCIGVIGTRYRENGEAYTWNKTNPGDKLYAADIFITDTALKELEVFRLIRPVNKEDVKKMNIPAWQKLKMVSQLDTNNKEVVIISAEVRVSQDRMFKSHTAFIGTYVKRDSTLGRFGEPHINTKLYAIKPNMPVLETGFLSKKPNDYVFADEYYYVEPRNVRLNEPSVFLKN